MLPSVLIVLHATAGLAALAAGSAALWRRWPFPAYFWSLAACIVFLAAVIGVDWSRLGTPSRAVFCAFIALGGYMIWRADQARRVRLAGAGRRSPRYLDHLGFTLVALLDAAVVIAVLDSGTPAWVVAAIGAAIAAGGHYGIRVLKARLRRPQVAWLC
jgi:hypothetical protein